MEELHKIFADFQQKVVEKENSLRRVGDSDMDLFFFKSDWQYLFSRRFAGLSLDQRQSL